MQEEAMKENTAAVHAQVPVDVATFLLNEKRNDIHARLKVEARLKVAIVLIPNVHLETPNYTVRHGCGTTKPTKMGEAPGELQMVRTPRPDRAAKHDRSERGDAASVEQAAPESAARVVEAVTETLPPPVATEPVVLAQLPESVITMPLDEVTAKASLVGAGQGVAPELTKGGDMPIAAVQAEQVSANTSTVVSLTPPPPAEPPAPPRYELPSDMVMVETRSPQPTAEPAPAGATDEDAAAERRRPARERLAEPVEAEPLIQIETRK
jgi:hypothetical protein